MTVRDVNLATSCKSLARLCTFLQDELRFARLASFCENIAKLSARCELFFTQKALLSS